MLFKSFTISWKKIFSIKIHQKKIFFYFFLDVLFSFLLTIHLNTFFKISISFFIQYSSYFHSKPYLSFHYHNNKKQQNKMWQQINTQPMIQNQLNPWNHPPVHPIQFNNGWGQPLNNWNQPKPLGAYNQIPQQK